MASSIPKSQADTCQERISVCNLVELLRERAKRIPRSTAYLFLDDGETEGGRTSFGELDRRARELAARLQALHCFGQRALLLYPPGLRYIEGFFACLYAGVIAVPAYPPSRHHVQRLVAIINDAQASLILTTEELQNRIADRLQLPNGRDGLLWLTTDSMTCGEADKWIPPEITADTLAFLQYTSGSTGEPKGVMVSHANLLANQEAIKQSFGHSEQSTVVGWLPLYHDMGLIGNVLQPLYLGSTAILMSPMSFLENPVRWLRAISHYRAHTSGGPNFAYDMCVRKVSDAQKRELDLSCWKVAFNGAEPVRASTLEKFAEAFAGCGFRRQAWFPCYGLAEATLLVSGPEAGTEPTELHTKQPNPSTERPAAEETSAPLVECGRAWTEHRIVIADPDRHTIRAEGQIGEIWAAGPSIAQGYWNRPELSEQTFRARLADGSTGQYLRTGDLGLLMRGRLFVTGRIKDLLIIRGRNYYPHDLERALEETVLALRTGGTAAFADSEEGEDGVVVVAEVQREALRREGTTKIFSAMQHSLANVSDAPIAELALVLPGAVPRTSSGKLRRGACRTAYLDGSLSVLARHRPEVIAGSVGDRVAMARAAFSESFAKGPAAERLPELTQFLIDQATHLIGGTIELAPHLPVASAGLDSLKILGLKHAVEDLFGSELSFSPFLADLSFAELAEELLSNKRELDSSGKGLSEANSAVRGEPFALSHSQRAMWMVHQSEPGSIAYNLHLALRIDDPLDPACLQQALNCLLARHTQLHTQFRHAGGSAVLQARRTDPSKDIARLTLIDAQGWTNQRLQADMASRARQPFDLATDHLLRVALYQLGNEGQVVLFCAHHIALDLWSLLVLVRELEDDYQSLARGENPRTKLPSAEYADFVDWQERYLGSVPAATAWEYWRTQLAGPLPILALPVDKTTDTVADPVSRYAGSSDCLRVPAASLAGILNVARQHGASLQAILLAAYNVLLYRYTGQSDLIVGVPASGRTTAQFANVVGNFVNPLPLRSRLTAGLTFSELLVQVRDSLRAALSYQDFPFPVLVDRLRPERNADQWPIYQTWFVLQQAQTGTDPALALLALGEDGPSVNLGAWELQPVALDQRIEIFDLRLMAAQTGRDLLISFQYRRACFTPQTIARMAAHFDALLQQIVACPNRCVGDYDLLRSIEHEQILTAWNASDVDYGEAGLLPELLAEQAKRTPEAPALFFDGRQLTYRQLHARANRLARGLISQGAGPETVIAVYARRSIEMVLALLGTMKTGAAYLPLDPELPTERLLLMLSDAQPSCLLAQSGLNIDWVPATQALVEIDPEVSSFSHERDDLPEVSLNGEFLAYVLYTSGSTGRPKGVGVPHRGLRNRLLWMQSQYDLQADDAVLQKTPYSFDVSVWEFFWPLMTGARLVLAKPEDHKDPARLIELIDSHQITVMHFVPSMLRAFLEVLENLPASSASCASLKQVICSGEALSTELAARFSRRLQAALHNLYGPTEASIDVSHWTYRSSSENVDTQITVPIGRPVANTQLYVLDRRLLPVPIGVTGEVYIAGVQLARGYLNRPDLTAAAFRPNPFASEPGARLYRTGDLGRWRPDGAIDFLGRVDHQVKLRGFRIELGEIESALRQFDGVTAAVATVREDKPGEKRLVAYVIPAANTSIDSDSLRTGLRSILPDYMVPAVITNLAALPLNANGKLDRSQLPAPDFSHALAPSGRAPRAGTEAILAAIWADVLQLPSVGVEDDFFALGGDSILSIQVVSRARQAGLRTSPREIFQHPTVAGLAAAIDAHAEAALDTRTVNNEFEEARCSASDTASIPFTPIQRWFFARELVNPHHWNQAVLIACPADLHRESLEAAVQSLVQRHDALRLRFRVEDGNWLQPLAVEDEVAQVEYEDLSGGDADDLKQTLYARCKYWQAQLHITQGPLLRIVWFGGDRHSAGYHGGRLLLTIHHLAVDAVSWHVLLNDLDTLYDHYRQHAGQTLPAVDTILGHTSCSYRQWALRLQKYAQGLSLVQTQSLPPIASLPVDHTEGGNCEADIATHTLTLTPDITRSLLTEASAAYRTTTQELLLTAFALVITDWAACNEVVLDLEAHGRDTPFDDVDLSRSVGWFTAVFPVRLRTVHTKAEASALALWIMSVKETVRRATQQALESSLCATYEPAALKPAVLFNFLGSVVRTAGTNKHFKYLHQLTSGSRAPENPRGYEWELNSYIADQQLHIDWSYSAARYEPDTITTLAQRLQAAIEDIVRHCQTPANAGLTPVDFPLADLEQTELDQLSVDTRSVEDIYPLGPMQEGLLFHSLMHPGTGIYHMQDRYGLRGHLDVSLVQCAWQRVMDRHPVLRTGFVWEGVNRPHQIVFKNVPLPFDYLDLRGLSPAFQTERIDALLADELRQGFDLAKPPLLRVRLVRLAEERWQLIRSHHHILMDAWCTSLMLQDFLEQYAEISSQRPAPMRYARSFRDYIAWLQVQDRNAAESFWRQYLSGFGEPTPLGIAHGPEREDDITTAAVQDAVLLLSETDTEALNTAAQQHRLTVNTYIQAAWALLLNRYSGRGEVLFGVTVAGRPTELSGIERTLGLFINSLPLRVKLAPQATGLEFMHALLQQNFEQRQYEHLALSQIQQLSELPRGTALFDSLLVFENTPIAAELRAEGQSLGFDETVANRTHTNYPITVVAIPGQALHLQITYQQERFEAVAIERMLEHFRTLLLELVRNPGLCLGALQPLPEAEYQSLLDLALADSDQVLPHGDFIELFKAQLAKTPTAIAASCGTERLSYSGLDSRAEHIAEQLRTRGLGTDDVVALLAERGIDLLCMIVGVFKTGAAYLPLDPDHPSARQAQVVKLSRTRLVLTQSGFADDLKTALTAGELAQTPEVVVVPGFNSSVINSKWETGARQSVDGLFAQPNKPATQRPDATTGESSSTPLAYVIYTSGSTGTPKGAMVERAGMLNNLTSKIPALGLSAEDVIAQTAPQSFDISVWQFLTGLVCGARIEIIPTTIVGDPAVLLDELASRQVTVVELVPSLIQALLDLPGPLPQLPALRWLLPTGEALPPELCRRWCQHFPNVPMLNAYGPAECSDDVAYHRIDTAPPPGLQRVPIGRPVPNLRMYLVDRQLRPVPLGVPGEIACAGIGVGRGYLNRPDLTASAFVPDPFSTVAGARLYLTGDLGRWLPDGSLEYLGRLDQQVKVRGFRIELGEIEAALAGLAGISQAVAMVREDAPGDRRLVGYVVGEDGFTTDVEVHRKQLQSVLPEYMVPVAIVILQAMPLNANGKIDRKALPAPDFTRFATEQFVAPRTATESALAEIWAEVLRLDKVGVNDNFFALGGDSILSIQVVSRARRAGFDVSPRDVFQNPTVAGLAALKQASTEDYKGEADDFSPEPFALAELDTSLLQRLREQHELEDLYPLTPMQEGMLFHSRLNPGTGMYLMQDRYRVEGAMDVASFHQAWQDVVDQYPIFRTAFVWEAGQRPHQAIHRNVVVRFEELDWSERTEAEQRAALEELLESELRSGFDLAEPSALRVRLIRLNQDTFYFTRSYHHILMDAWCLSLLMVAVLQGYSARVRTGQPGVPAARPYRDYIAWLQAQDASAAEQFWREYLLGFTEPTPLVPEQGRTVQAHGGVADHIVHLSEADTRRLRENAQRLRITPNTIVQAAWALTIAHYGNSRDVVFGVTVAGRPAELHGCEATIGIFINTLALRAKIDPGRRLDGWLVELFEDNLRLRQYEHSPLAEVQRLSQVPRGTALFQSLLVFENAPIDPSLRAENLEFNILNHQDRVHTNFPLTIEVLPEDSLVLRLTYDRALFTHVAVGRMLGHFQQLLSQMAREPERPVGAYMLLTAPEQQTQLVDWNRTALDLPLTDGFLPLFLQQVQTRPDAVAAEYGDDQWTYRTLDERATAVAEALVSEGIREDDVVALLADRGLELLAMIVGVFKAGAAYLPLDPDHPPARLAQIIKLSRSPIVVTQAAFLDALAAAIVTPEANSVPTVLVCENQMGSTRVHTCEHEDQGPALRLRESVKPEFAACAQRTNRSARPSETEASPSALAYVIYTSGSTGQPKGAMVDRAGMLNNLLNKIPTLGLTPNDCIAQTASACFDISVWQFLTALLCGARVRIIPAVIAQDPTALLQEVETAGVTVLESVPSLIASMLDSDTASTLPRLRWLLPTGEALAPELCRRWLQRFPHVSMLNAYGPAECADDVAYHRIDATPGPEVSHIPIGRPAANLSLYILNQFLEPVPVGVPGELCVAGIGVGRGYLNDPGRTARAFIPNPFASDLADARLYRSGDRARYLADGTIEFLGRIDHQVKLRGYRLELGEVEAKLRDHPAVSEAAVCVREDTPGDQRLVAYLVEVGGQSTKTRSSNALVENLRTHLRALLPEYMVPSAIVFLDDLPRNPNGKLDRHALPVPDQTAQLEHRYVAPRTPTEQRIAEIWAQVLRLERVGVHDHFFDLGGHSLLATQVIARVQVQFAVDLPLRTLFAATTVAAMAETVDAAIWLRTQNTEVPSTVIDQAFEDIEI